MPSQQQASSSTPRFTTLPWGCKILTNPEDDWPVIPAITHPSSPCWCDQHGGERAVFRDFLIVVAHEFYYRKDPEKYDSKWSGEMLRHQAKRLDIDFQFMIEGLAKSVPWGPSLRRYELVQKDGKVVSLPLPISPP
ncbi:hypothetical protein F5Y10DRAFT_290169 [Nemania abortiva]|nr:hypothetical protein F5Y10DRAFT_290169 [Nemania abortiva]